MTSNLRLARSPGNVIIPATASGLPEDSVVNVSQIMSVDREFLVEHVGKLPPRYIASIDDGLRFILDL